MPKAVYWLLVIAPICAFCTAPFFTFLARNVIGTVVLSLAVPFLIYLGAGALILWLYNSGTVQSPSESQEWIDEQKLHRWLFAYFAIALPIYCASLYYLGYRWFQRLEVADLLERQIRLAGALHQPVERVLNRVFSGRLRHIASLAAKELHIQQNAITVWLIFTLLQIAVVIYIDVGHPESPDTWYTVPLGIYFMLMPLVIGASAFAEEQKLGVRAWHLAVPISFAKQWLIKAAVAFILLVLLGALVPSAWLASANFLCPALRGHLIPGNLLPPVAAFALIPPLLATATAFFVSSFSRDTLRAIVASAAVYVAFGFILPFAAKNSEYLLPHARHILRSVFGPTAYLFTQTTAYVAIAIVLLSFLIPPLFFSFRNFKALNHGSREIWISILLAYTPGLVLFFLFMQFPALAQGF